MPINVSCHGCGKGYAVPEKRAGQRFKCRDCGTIVSVPADEWGGSGEGFGFGNHGADPAGAGYYDAGNPYASPVDPGPSRGHAGRADALSRTNVCAIFLYIIASLSIMMHCANIVLTIADPDNAAGPGMRAPANATERSARMAGSLAAGFTILALQVLTIVGAYNLQKLQNYSLAMTAAIISCIPCCSPCVVLGIPFGIWALVLLNDSSIKRHFQ